VKLAKGQLTITGMARGSKIRQLRFNFLQTSQQWQILENQGRKWKKN
jgi:hypothetical protein